jgi:outer membrane protein assembly factor BamB
MRKKLAVLVGALGLVAAGLVVAWVVIVRDKPAGEVDTEFAGITVITDIAEPPAPEPPPPTITETGPPAVVTEPPEPVEGPCWTEFGGNPQRTQARTLLSLGKPTKPAWARAVGSYMEYPPSFCDGTLYVNTFEGLTIAVDAATGKFIWQQQGGVHASTPAIAGDRLIVSSHDGTVTALRRSDGGRLWQIRTEGKVESSPVAIGDAAYFGVTDGRVFAVDVETGAIRWGYDTGGRINSSPSIWGRRLCVTTYAGSIFCLDRITGRKLWHTYVKRDTFRYESFYASPSTDGERLYVVARSGRVLALSASSGRVLWTQSVSSLGYSTPAIAGDRVLVGGFDGRMRAFAAQSGRLLWESLVGGRIAAPALVVGDLVLFSTLEQRTYAARLRDGKVIWTFNAGKYAPGIATDRRYYFSLNGLLVAFNAAGSRGA